mgnify:CR=1 FL=1
MLLLQITQAVTDSLQVAADNLDQAIANAEGPDKISLITQQLIDAGVRAGGSILKAVLVFIVGRFLVSMLNKLAARMMDKRHVDVSIKTFVKSLVNILLTILLIISVVGALGVETTSFAALLASAGVAIGNALTAPRQEQIEEDAYIPEVREVRVQKYKKQPVQQPISQLKLRKIRFIDDNRSHVIDAGENSKIIFEIMNEGRNPVYNVVPVVETVGKVKHLGISPSVMVEEILPGEGIRYTASIHAGEKLKDGEVTFRVAVADENGVICDSQEFTLPTQRRN